MDAEHSQHLRFTESGRSYYGTGRYFHDSPVTTANVRFPIFFPEKRPFFLERIDIFQSGLNIVNTRAIVDPDVAMKLTGRRGRNTFGLLYASDNFPGNFTKDERQELFECQLERQRDPGRVCGIERFLD